MAKRSCSVPGYVYPFTHEKDDYIKTNIKGKSFISKDGRLQISIDGTIQVKGSVLDGYSWDGCTPRWKLFNLVFGTPDGQYDYLTEKKITHYASMFHDALYQYRSEIPISRKDADLIFLYILKEANFVWANIYYATVRLFGAMYGKWGVTESTSKLHVTEYSWRTLFEICMNPYINNLP